MGEFVAAVVAGILATVIGGLILNQVISKRRGKGDVPEIGPQTAPLPLARAASFGRQGRLIGHGVPLIGVAAIAVFNGSLHALVFDTTFYSPVYDSVSQYVATFSSGSWFDGFARGVLAAGPQLYQSLTSLLIAAMTLVIAGIPAALYERLRGLKASTSVSLGIWLAGALLLTLPTIVKALSGDEF